jgi:D-3-phosphoglycerate dehydrogenase
MTKILIAPAALAGISGPFVNVLKGAGYELVYPNVGRQMNEQELLTHLAGVKAAIAGSEPYTPRVLKAHPQLKVVARAGVGYDAVDLAAATEQGIAVTIAPNTNQDAVAEHTMLLMLALAKNLISQHGETVAGHWPRGVNLPLRDRTLGIAGLGRIGKAVALRGECFRMKLLAYEPYPDQAFVKQHGIQLVSWETLVTESDYLTLHVPSLPQSRHMINKDSLAKMKPSAFLINTSRGPLVDEAALYDALKAKRIAGAGLDVFEEEPPGRHSLFGLNNVVITPHAAGVDLQSRDDMALSCAETIVALARGDWPAEKVVNPEVKAKFRW